MILGMVSGLIIIIIFTICWKMTELIMDLVWEWRYFNRNVADEYKKRSRGNCFDFMRKFEEQGFEISSRLYNGGRAIRKIGIFSSKRGIVESKVNGKCIAFDNVGMTLDLFNYIIVMIFLRRKTKKYNNGVKGDLLKDHKW